MTLIAAYHWDWHFVRQSLPYLWGGVVTTLEVCGVAAALTIPISLLGAALRGSRLWPLRALGSLYVDVFRSTPFLVQLIWFYFVLPSTLNFPITGFQAAVVSLALYIGAYQTEVVRTGIESLPAGQREAGLALGMRGGQVYRRVILPQAASRMIPPSLSMLIILIKESAVVSAVSVTDLMWRSGAVASRSYRSVEPLTFAGLAYVAMILPLAFLARHLHHRQRSAFE